jgi:hypothetical protein
MLAGRVDGVDSEVRFQVLEHRLLDVPEDMVRNGLENLNLFRLSQGVAEVPSKIGNEVVLLILLEHS